MPRLYVSVALQPGDKIRELSDSIQNAAQLNADGSGCGFGYRDMEFQVDGSSVQADQIGARVKAAFPDREVTWSVHPDSGQE